MTLKLGDKISGKYKVGDLIYDGNIYDGMNSDLTDLKFYKKWLPKNKDARILELCCGTGRLTLPIAEDGYSFCGVDNSPSMLKQAKAKASQIGLKVDFMEADIRTLDLPEKFDLIFADPPFDMQEIEKVPDLIFEHELLDEEGLFILEHSDSVSFSGHPHLKRHKNYGKVNFSFFE